MAEKHRKKDKVQRSFRFLREEDEILKNYARDVGKTQNAVVCDLLEILRLVEILEKDGKSKAEIFTGLLKCLEQKAR